MSTATEHPTVSAWLAKANKWQDEYTRLRAIALSSGLTEDFKWGNPCYTLDGQNVVLIHGFKEYCAFLFFKGALMQDPKGILIQQTANVQSARQVRFTSAQQIDGLKKTLKAYIKDAIQVEQSGAKVEFKKTTEFTVPEEFQSRLDEDLALRDAFQALTPGRQRAYLLHFSSAKQSSTRVARIEKSIPMIFAGKGLND
ncbi:YdeI/OmpD-associated family protein [Oxalobacteraceae bacterium A2-2]